MKIKRLLHDLFVNGAFELYIIDTVRYFLEMNRVNDDETIETISIDSQNNSHADDDHWLDEEQMRLVTHKFYSKRIYDEMFIPMINSDSQQKQTIADLLIYLDRLPLEQEEEVIDVQDMNNKLTL
jgi:uncharacterized membrane protein YheB (UPF0754 family)